jgi:DNA polymerase-1
MVSIPEVIKGLNNPDDVRMVLQVHDELIFEIKKEKVDAVVPELVKIMEGTLAGKEDFGVPLIAEVKQGKNWNEMK